MYKIIHDLSKPLLDEANSLSNDVLLEENRAAVLAETFDGFVIDYIEEWIIVLMRIETFGGLVQDYIEVH